MTIQKIPIYLLTGFLGSGKTTLLKEWLKHTEFKDAALIINELGEVGVDQALLTNASEAASLVANACVCCTGLPGLSQALEDLFWARLERRVHKFPQLIIETTGLAMPGPILETLAQNPLLLERYEWAGTLTCVSANAYKEVMLEFKEAQAQLTHADICILTKTDLLDEESHALARLQLSEFFAHHGLKTPLLSSKLASLSAREVLDALSAFKSLSQAQQAQQIQQAPSCEPGHEHVHDHGHSTHLHAQAHFWSFPETSSLAHTLLKVQELKNLLGSHLLRVKGFIQCPEGVQVIQMSPFDVKATVSVYEEDHGSKDPSGAKTPWGLTVIVSSQLQASRVHAMNELLGLSQLSQLSQFSQFS